MQQRTRRFVARAALFFAIIVVAIQFVPTTRTNPPVVVEVAAPADVAAILRRACYDCHSHETQWPWYSKVAPMSWLVVGHVNHGRGDLNFSDWPALDFAAQDHVFREISEAVREGEMPLRGYVLLHPQARLSRDDAAALVSWAEGN